MFLPLRSLDQNNIPLVPSNFGTESEKNFLTDSRIIDDELWISFSENVSVEDVNSKTHKCYLKALRIATELKFQNLVRVWNVVPEINSYFQGIESYQHFCAGRRRAYSEFEIAESQFPVASAIGSHDSKLHFTFLFSKQASLKISNPKQIEAFHYPENYGPTPPSFSRAAIHKNKLYISGTASIRGHQTVYENDLESQFHLTLDNMYILLQEARLRSNKKFEFADMDLRVYLRHADSFGWVTNQLNKIRSLQACTTFLNADICRKDLLIEIEGVANAI
jgi:chorismate lyase / 3-hydroxybenzoate synthase